MKMIGNEKLLPDTLKIMKLSPSNYSDTTWYAYQNHDLGHPDLGHIMVLAVGSKNTYTEAPERMPDMPKKINWRYIKVGIVDLQTGDINEIE